MATAMAASPQHWGRWSASRPRLNGVTPWTSLVALLAEAVRGPVLWAILGALVLLVGAIVYRLARRKSFMFALAAALPGGPIVAFHVYMQDYLLTLQIGRASRR